MNSGTKLLIFISFLIVCGCQPKTKTKTQNHSCKLTHKEQSIITDCNYTFNEAIARTKAPQYIIDKLELINVTYYSTDGMLHQGQVLTNKKMVYKIKTMFFLMRQVKFPIAHAIPVVKYHWDDNLSMQNNNTYSFCYRNVSYSKHAKGMAIDINPYLNPVRYKNGTHKTKPKGAIYNPSKAGTFEPSSPLIEKFLQLGLRWGHTFSNKCDDHHFELK